MNEIESKAAALLDNPRIYKPSPRAKGLREMVVRPNYVVFYRESPTLVEIVNVIHARRQWPPIKRQAK